MLTADKRGRRTRGSRRTGQAAARPPPRPPAEVEAERAKMKAEVEAEARKREEALKQRIAALTDERREREDALRAATDQVAELEKDRKEGVAGAAAGGRLEAGGGPQGRVLGADGGHAAKHATMQGELQTLREDAKTRVQKERARADGLGEERTQHDAVVRLEEQLQNLRGRGRATRPRRSTPRSGRSSTRCSSGCSARGGAPHAAAQVRDARAGGRRGAAQAEPAGRTDQAAREQRAGPQRQHADAGGAARQRAQPAAAGARAGVEPCGRGTARTRGRGAADRATRARAQARTRTRLEPHREAHSWGRDPAEQRENIVVRRAPEEKARDNMGVNGTGGYNQAATHAHADEGVAAERRRTGGGARRRRGRRVWGG